MNDIKFYVRTTGDRKFNYDIPYEVILDTERKPIDSFINLLEKIDGEQAVILEDDLVLCDNFVDEISKVIEKYPNDIINFFTRPDRYFTTSYNSVFSYNQCTYYPKGIGKYLADKMREIRKPYHRKMYGMLLNEALNESGIRHLNYRPCLVQHVDGLSLLTGIVYNRQTIYFKNYLDELGISYEDAFKNENKDKLTRLLERDKVKWAEIKRLNGYQ